MKPTAAILATPYGPMPFESARVDSMSPAQAQKAIDMFFLARYSDCEICRHLGLSGMVFNKLLTRVFTLREVGLK